MAVVGGEVGELGLEQRETRCQVGVRCVPVEGSFGWFQRREV